MSFPRYAKYKASGVEWLGDVPAHWEVKPIGSVAEVVNGFPFNSEDFNSDVGAPLVRIRDIGKEATEVLFHGAAVPGAEITKHDVLIAMDGDFNVGRWRGEGKALMNQRVCCVRGQSQLLTRLLEYVLPKPLAAINAITFSTTVKHLSSSQVVKTRVAVPPEREIASILNFLDRETAKIDALVAEQQRLIELLKEKRQAVISHAVTKGLDPTAKRKPSGIEWLGDVPAHWEVAPLASRFRVQLGKMLDTSRVTGMHLRPYLRVFDVQWGKVNVSDLPLMDFDEDDRAKFRLLTGDVLVNEGGSYPGRASVWKGDLEECYYQKALHRLRAIEGAGSSPQFLYYVLHWAVSKGVFVAGGNEATIEHLPAEKLRRYRFAFPSGEEQRVIASFLDHETVKIDALVAEVERAITLLQERRTALISAAVTGQIDVTQRAQASA